MLFIHDPCTHSRKNMTYISVVLILTSLAACTSQTLSSSTIAPSDSEDHPSISPEALQLTSTTTETAVPPTAVVASPTPTQTFLAPTRIAIRPDPDTNITPEESSQRPWVISGPVEDSDVEYWVIQDLSSEPRDDYAYRFSGWSAEQYGEYLPASSPENGLVAFLTAEDYVGRDKELIVYDLPNNRQLLRISVFAPWHQPSSKELFGGGFWESELMAALKSAGAFMWSPDSRYLAFTAVIDGPSSDVYLFDTQSLEVERLTDGPTQADLMGWSPDGKWLLHSAWTKGRLGCDATPIPAIQSIWAVSMHSKDVQLVEEIDWESEGEIIIGWSSNDTVLVSSWDSLYQLGTNSFAVREFDLSAQSSRQIFDGPFDDVAYDPISGTLAFAGGHFVPSFSGLHLLPKGSTSPTQIENGSWRTDNVS